MADVIDSFSGDYSFLSNFHPVKVELEGVKYPSVEHAYQAAKTMNLDHRVLISKLPTGGQAKRAGGNVVLRDDWKKVRLQIMESLLDQKFRLNADLAALLIATDPAVLIEGNIWGDKFWGMCNGNGCNYLGQLLMHIRGDLKNG